MDKVTGEAGPGVSLVPDPPEEFGLRVIWQSEDERIEAAEFMIATRMQEDVRRRVAKVALDLREQNREKFSTYVAQHSGD
jgi:hypothetical protein